MLNFRQHHLHVLCTFVPYQTRYYDVSSFGEFIFGVGRRVHPAGNERFNSKTPQIVFRTYGTGQLAFLWDWVRCLSRGYRVCSNFMILRGN